MDAATVTAVLAQTDRELWLLTAQAESRRGGLIATFVSQASIVLEAPRMLVGLAKHHYTRELVEASGAFALHLLAESHLDWVWRFGLETGRGRDKLDGMTYTVARTSSPIVSGAAGWLDCSVEARFDTGDRTLYLAEVVDAGGLPPSRVLTLQRLLQLAPADKLQRLKDLIVRDSAADAAAIEAWRRRLERSPGLTQA
jgi:flavin reductase (DIM6/NTAB) family NADH-FMN oxidoreductase RutF